MGVLTKNPNVLMRRWMEVYLNLNMLLSTDPTLSKTLDELKMKLAECNEVAMRFFDMVDTDPEAEG